MTQSISYFLDTGTRAPFSSNASTSLSSAQRSLASTSSPSSLSMSSHAVAATGAATFASAIHRSMSLRTRVTSCLYLIARLVSLAVAFANALYCFNNGVIARRVGCWGKDVDGVEGLSVGRK